MTQLSLSQDPASDAEAKKRNGAVLLGQSTYQSSNVPDLDKLQALAKDVGADLVIYGSSFMGSRTEMRVVYETVAVPSQNQTTNVTVNNNNNTSRGPVLPQFDPGTSSKSKTEMVVRNIPEEIRIYQWQAFFFRSN